MRSCVEEADAVVGLVIVLVFSCVLLDFVKPAATGETPYSYAP